MHLFVQLSVNLLDFRRKRPLHRFPPCSSPFVCLKQAAKSLVKRSSCQLLLLCHRADAVHSQNDRQDDQQRGQDHTHVAPSQPGTAGRDGQDVGLQGKDQRGQGHDQHEDHGDVEHLVVLACLPQPGRDRQQTQGSQQLVGCAKQRPDVRIPGQAVMSVATSGLVRTFL